MYLYWNFTAHQEYFMRLERVGQNAEDRGNPRAERGFSRVV